MYTETITLFNRKRTENGDVWYPTVMRGVDLNIDKAAIASKYGAASQDSAVLHVRYQMQGENIIVSGKCWKPPKEWQKRTGDDSSGTFTFASGHFLDFMFKGGAGIDAPVKDEDYAEGFYNYMNSKHDYVFAVTSAAVYSLIPHFEVTAR